MKSAAIAGALICAIAAPLPVSASGRDLPDHWEPAMLLVSADTGIADASGDAVSLTLRRVHPLVTLVRSLHDDRHFDAYPITEFAESYNTCNAMKDELGLWHDDGYNALLVYANGPENGERASHLRYSPLVTSPQANNPERVFGGDHAAIPLFIKTAQFGADDRTLSLTLAPGQLVPGTYTGVLLKTECLDVLMR